MPNRRRRKLSTAMSAVAALAVASPFAVAALSDLTASKRRARTARVRAGRDGHRPAQRAHVRAAVSLSQFGVILPTCRPGSLGASEHADRPGAHRPGG